MPNSIACALAVGVVASCWPLFGHGQTPTPSSGSQDTGPQPTFSVAVDLVTTDVIPRDSNGAFVADLTTADFEVKEDGVVQDIASLVLVHGGRTFSLASPAAPPPVEGLILPAPRPTSDAAGRVFLLFIDDLHLQFQNTGRVRQLFRDLADTLIHEGDLFAVVSTGPSSIAIDLTYDRARLDAAIERITPNGLRPTEILQGMESRRDGPVELRYRAQVAFATAYDIMKNLEQVKNRRKAVVYVSNGYDFDPFPEGRRGQSQLFQNWEDSGSLEDISRADRLSASGGLFAEADLVTALADLTRAANRANATFYTIDPRGLVGGVDINEPVDPVEWDTHVRRTQQSLRVLAEETGGFAVVNRNNFSEALKQIDAETSDYYVLGYYSSNPDPTDRTRSVNVTVNRPGVNVWFRESYSLPPQPAASQ